MIVDPLESAQEIAGRVSSWIATQENSYAPKRGPERVPEVNELRRELSALGIKDLDYFAEGLDCIQYAQATRAAIVLGWTGLIDLLQAKLGRDSFGGLNAILNHAFHGVYKKAGQIKTRSELAEYFDDALLLQAGLKLNYFQSHVYKQLDAMRDERNNCAHVQEYAVTPRIALGFYAKLVNFLPHIL